MTASSRLSAVNQWNRFAREHATIEHALGRVLEREQGIGLTDFRALAAIAGDPSGELRLQDLQEILGLNQSSVSRLVGRLEARSLAYREVCDDDRRGVYCVITDLGRNCVREATPTFERALDEALAASPPGFTLFFRG